ncbi:MAG: hypothetical protein VKJ24_11480 [Synechococcales bacterium]|nr:hypothetical protein [Synechococcales bacterium]
MKTITSVEGAPKGGILPLVWLPLGLDDTCWDDIRFLAMLDYIAKLAILKQ